MSSITTVLSIAMWTAKALHVSKTASFLTGETHHEPSLLCRRLRTAASRRSVLSRMRPRARDVGATDGKHAEAGSCYFSPGTWGPPGTPGCPSQRAMPAQGLLGGVLSESSWHTEAGTTGARDWTVWVSPAARKAQHLRSPTLTYWDWQSWGLASRSGRRQTAAGSVTGGGRQVSSSRVQGGWAPQEGGQGRQGDHTVPWEARDEC